jgi:hypothetical protein
LLPARFPRLNEYEFNEWLLAFGEFSFKQISTIEISHRPKYIENIFIVPIFVVCYEILTYLWKNIQVADRKINIDKN